MAVYIIWFHNSYYIRYLVWLEWCIGQSESILQEVLKHTLICDYMFIDLYLTCEAGEEGF